MPRAFSEIDLPLFLPASFLIAVGGIILMSVSPESFPRQFIYIGLAFFFFFLFSNIDAQIFKSFPFWLYFFSIFLLVITIFFGTEIRGSTRWLLLGPFTLQTSELIKPFLLLFFAGFFTKSDGLKKFLTVLPLAAIPVFMVLQQPDLGSALVIAAGFLGAFFIAGAPFIFLGLGLIFTILLSPILWNSLETYQKDRIYSFISPHNDPLGTGYNAIQAVIAVGSGGFFGRGLGQGTQSQLAFLPERHTDFIFAALSEELGFLAATGVITAFAVLLLRVVYLLRQTDDAFEKIFLGGVVFTIFFQSAVNIGMNLGLLPVTGIPLPFVSSGGSSLLAMSILLGICSSISRDLSSRSSLGIIGR